MNVHLRPFEERDIPQKVCWLNDSRNNRFLHYDFPLSVEKTKVWFSKNRGRTDRYDAVIECDGMAVGIIGLLTICNGQAEYYITIGEEQYKGKGIAKQASKLVLFEAFRRFGLEKVYLYTEVGNIEAQRLFEGCGFIREGIAVRSALNREKYVDRYYYVISRSRYFLYNDMEE